MQVRKVVDGDTLRLVDGRSVRMIGLNAPETGKKGKSAEPYAEAARRRLQTLVDESAGQVALRVGRQGKDHYGRTLANVYGRNGTSFEAQLLSEGLAYQVAIAPNVALVDCQRSAERAARQARRGLWRNSPVQPAGSISRSGFAVVTGRVDSVQRNRGGLWIELQGGVVLRIEAKSLASFDQTMLRRLPGRTVEARGWVLDRARRGGLKAGQARWLLPLTHPSMLSPAGG